MVLHFLCPGAGSAAGVAGASQRLRIGSAELTVEDRIGRCAATNVDTTTGQRDLTVPRDMLRGFGHDDCGIYARVTLGGQVVPGDYVTVLD